MRCEYLQYSWMVVKNLQWPSRLWGGWSWKVFCYYTETDADHKRFFSWLVNTGGVKLRFLLCKRDLFRTCRSRCRRERSWRSLDRVEAVRAHAWTCWSTSTSPCRVRCCSTESTYTTTTTSTSIQRYSTPTHWRRSTASSILSSHITRSENLVTFHSLN